MRQTRYSLTRNDRPLLVFRPQVNIQEESGEIAQDESGEEPKEDEEGLQQKVEENDLLSSLLNQVRTMLLWSIAR